MIDKGQWREIGQDTGVTPLLFTRSAMGFLMTTESQDLGLTSHPKDGFISSYCFKLFQLQFTVTVSKSCFREHSISLFYSHQMWEVKSGVDTKEQAVFGSLHTWFVVCWCVPEFGKPLSHWLNETNSSSVKALFIFLWVQCSACIIKTCTTTTKANMTQHVRPLVIFTVKFNRNG